MKCEKCGFEFATGKYCPQCGQAIKEEKTIDEHSVHLNENIPETLSDDKEFQNFPMGSNNDQTPPLGMNNQNQPFVSPQQPYMGNPSFGSNGYANNAGNQPFDSPNQQFYPNNFNSYNGNPQGMGGQTVDFTENPNQIYSNNDNKKKSSKAPFFIAIAAIAVAIVAIVILLVYVLGKEKKDDKNKNTDKTTTSVSSEEPGGTTDDGKVTSGTSVYEDSVLKLEVTGADFDDYGNLVAVVDITNYSDKTLSISSLMSSLDDANISGYMSYTVNPGVNITTDFTVYDTALKSQSITDFSSINIVFSAYDYDTYDTMSGGSISYPCDLSTTGIAAVDMAEYKEIFSDDCVTVYAKESIRYDEGLSYYYSDIYVENDTDKMITLSVNDSTINGETVDVHGGYGYMMPDTHGFVELYWYGDDINDKTKSFENIVLSYYSLDYSTYEELGAADISYTTSGVK